MSDIKQLLEKATRKTEMRWRVFAFDPEQDNKLVHTSKDAFDCIKMAGEYKTDLAKKNPNYIIEIVAESAQKNEADKMFLKKIEDVLHRYNLPSAKIVDERKVDNTHYIYKIDVNLTDYAKSLQKDAVNFDKLKKDNALKALSFLTIDGIYPQRNSQSILMQVDFHKGKPESSQKNEAVNAAKVKQDVEKAVKDYFKNDKDALEYVYVDSKKDSLGRTVIEVRAELGYNGMTKLADHLDKVVQKHDRYAYFEQESGGIMTAVFESVQKNEEKEFTIKLVTPFGKAKVCSWKANSVDAAVKEFLDANPAYRENKKGAVIAESAQKNETFKVGDRVSYKVSLTGNSYKGIVKQIKKDIYGDEIIQITEPDGRTSWKDAKDLVKESISDDIVREVKEEVKDGVKDLVQQDVDAKLNGEITPKDYQANFEEDVDDDSDGIFGDELANAEPDEPEQANESVDEKSLKSFLKSEYDRALKQAKSFSGTNNNFSNFYEGYAAAMKAIQEKLKL